MVVHLVVVLSNHYHFLLAPTDAKQLADFMGFVNSNIAREVGRLVGWKETFWGRRYQGIVVSDEVLAHLGQLEYFLANGVKENLVENPLQWPGVHCARALVEGCKLEGTWFSRTGYNRAQKRRKAGDPPVQENDYETAELLDLTPLPCLANLGAAQYRRFIEGLIERLVAEAAANREAKGSMVVGAARLQKTESPYPAEPDQEVTSAAIPRLFYRRSEGLRDAYSALAAAFRIASERLRSGDRGVLSPEGCFPPALPFSA